MLAFFLEEMREWRQRRMRKTILACAIPIALVAACSVLQPLLLALAVTLMFLALGWTEGNRYQTPTSSRRLLLAFPISSARIAGGKALASLAIWAFVALALSPPFALSAVAWGLSLKAASACLLAWLLCYFAALCIGLFSSLIFTRSEGLLGVSILFAWLVSSLALKFLAPSNPFVEVWDVMKDEGGAGIFIGMAADAIASAAFLAASGLALSRLRTQRNG
jgi:hypothetical protein